MISVASSTHPRRTRIAVFMALALAGSVTFSSSSVWAAESVAFEGSANPVIGAVYDWTVPAGVTVIEIDATVPKGKISTAESSILEAWLDVPSSFWPSAPARSCA